MISTLANTCFHYPSDPVGSRLYHVCFSATTLETGEPAAIPGTLRHSESVHTRCCTSVTRSASWLNPQSRSLGSFPPPNCPTRTRQLPCPPKRPNRAGIKPCTQDEVTSTVLPPMIASSGQYRLQGLIGSPRSSLSHVSQRLGCAVDAMQTALTRHIRGAPKNGYCTQHNHFPRLTCLRREKGRHVSLSQTCQGP